jgi:hypothetical protein
MTAMVAVQQLFAAAALIFDDVPTKFEDVRIYYIYYLLRSNAADGQRTADG